MAITKKEVFGWAGFTTNECVNVDSQNYPNLIKFYSLSQDGASFAGTDTAETMLKCGAGYMIYSSSVPYSADELVESDSVAGELLSLAENVFENFDYTGEPMINSKFHLTTYFINDKPTYRTLNGSWYIWFDGSVWILSNTKYTKDDVWYEGDTTNPNVDNFVHEDVLFYTEAGLPLFLEDFESTIITEADDPNFEQGESVYSEDGIVIHGEDGEEILFLETDDNPPIGSFHAVMGEGGINPFQLEDGIDVLELESA